MQDPPSYLFPQFESIVTKKRNDNIRIDPHSEFSLGPPGDSEISPGGGVGGRPGAVAPRPGARSWRRATPGRPGLTLTRSVDLLDRNPNTPPDGLVGDIPVALESAA